MPKVLRFMGANEAIQLLTGRMLEHFGDHNALGNRSTSVGFCFAIAEGEPAEAMHRAAKYLAGIVDIEVCLIGILNHDLKKSIGHYSIGVVDELCTNRYSLADFEEWALYTHEPLGPEIMLRLVSSANWETPVLAATSHEVSDA